jgi:hypothetical protein
MAHLNHCTDSYGWEIYKQQELIPDSVPHPDGEASLGLGLAWMWKKLLSLLADELIVDQQVEYLNRCLALDEFGQGEKSAASTLKRLWLLME